MLPFGVATHSDRTAAATFRQCNIALLLPRAHAQNHLKSIQLRLNLAHGVHGEWNDEAPALSLQLVALSSSSSLLSLLARLAEMALVTTTAADVSVIITFAIAATAAADCDDSVAVEVASAFVAVAAAAYVVVLSRTPLIAWCWSLQLLPARLLFGCLRYLERRCLRASAAERGAAGFGELVGQATRGRWSTGGNATAHGVAGAGATAHGCDRGFAAAVIVIAVAIAFGATVAVGAAVAVVIAAVTAAAA